MAFDSNNIDEILKVKMNPNYGFQWLNNKNIKKKNNSDEESHDDSDDDSDSIDNIEEGYFDDISQDDEDKTPDNDLVFQILDIDSYHAKDDENEKSIFNIMLFGKTNEGKSVYVNVEGFNPYFYVEIDPSYRKPICQRIINDIQKRIKKDHQDSLIDFTIERAHKFFGFTNNEKFNFLKLVFNNYDAMRSYARVFEMNHSMPYLNKSQKVNFKLYESNINPIIRFLHIQNIDPIGWCKIAKTKFKPFKDSQRKGVTDYVVNCNWKNIIRHECSDIHKFKILSFDIECTSEDGKFPQNRDGDEVIQIGMTYSILGDVECFKQVILCLKDTKSIDNAIVKCYKNEVDLLLAFTKEIRENDPDIITGYNTFGFDYDYLMNRAKKFDIYDKFSRFSRIKGFVCNFVEQKLESSAMGRNNLKYYNMPGRVNIDLMKYIQREHKLNGYSLDSVVANFIRDDIISSEYITIDDEDHTNFVVKSTNGIKKDDYIAIYYNDGPTDNRIGTKYQIVECQEKNIVLKGKINVNQYLKEKHMVFWCQAKDDVGPNDIFRLYSEGAKQRSIVAKYCLKDCSLCNRLIAKLQILPNSIGMGNVCCVPLSYLFLRGQSIKIFSLIAKQCREENTFIPTIKKKFTPEQKQEETDTYKKFIQELIAKDEDDDDDDAGYEGATVFEPIKGVHYEPIIVGDYSSLYPSSMIMKNLSHNSIVLDPKYDNLEGYRYHEQSYNSSDGTIKTCRFAEKIGDNPNETKSTIPRILMKLLATRKKCNALKESEKDPFKKAVWDGLQLAYKVTANSLYGQCGSAVSPVSMKDIAACTTSIGRNMLELARDFVENEMKDIISLIKQSTETKDDSEYIDYMHQFYKNVPASKLECKNKETGEYIYKGHLQYYKWLQTKLYDLLGKYNIEPKCIYGDTDSVFFKLNMIDRKTNEPKKDHESLSISIEVGMLVTAILNHTLDYPQGLAYEKVYWPFIIITKKRYVGNLYTDNPNKFKQKSMGLVTKRRDNADIVKMVVGGIIDQILNKRSSVGAVEFTNSTLLKIITGKYLIDKFIISKTLKDKDAYADWTKMVHVVLADRIAQRDAGNKPQSNDRIPFVYIETDKKVKLQGERVEHPQYIKDNNLKIDYMFYITNQIMKPAIQFLELIVKNPDSIFKKYLIREENRKSGIEPIMKFFQKADDDCCDNIKLNF